jgi:SAM-dependent methyltransferase
MARPEALTDQKFADHHVGLYHPDNIRNALREIAAANNTSNWVDQQDTLDRTAYYLGYGIHCHILDDFPSEDTPFQDFEKLHLPNLMRSQPLDILHFGCAGEASLELEMKRYRTAGLNVKSHATIDLSTIPLRRIQMLDNSSSNVYCADIARLPFPDGQFDLLVTDQLFGSNSRDFELSMLNEVHRVAKSGAQLVMKVFAGLDNLGVTHVSNDGLKWRKMAINKYGITNSRDNYAGLTYRQWKALGKRYARFVNAAYFNPAIAFSSFGEIEDLLNRAKLKLEEAIQYGSSDDVTYDSVGDFIIRASVA